MMILFVLAITLNSLAQSMTTYNCEGKTIPVVENYNAHGPAFADAINHKIIINPFLIASMSKKHFDFLMLHECSHILLNHISHVDSKKEDDADCLAAKLANKNGSISKNDFDAQIFPEVVSVPGDLTHYSGSVRMLTIQKCFTSSEICLNRTEAISGTNRTSYPCSHCMFTTNGMRCQHQFDYYDYPYFYYQDKQVCF